MRVLLTTVPTYGSFHPMIALARALIAAGHEVRVASPPVFEDIVQGVGLPFVPAGTDNFVRSAVAELGASSLDPRERTRRFMTEIVLGIQAHSMVRDVLTLIDSWRPDMLVRGWYEFGGYVAAEHRGLPHVVTGAVTFAPPPLFAMILDGLARLRSASDLPPDPDGTSMTRFLVLAPQPRSWVVPEATIPPTTHFVRPEPFQAVAGEPLPMHVAALPRDRPTVHASLGTLHNNAPGVYEAITAGLRDEPLNLVVTVGHDRNPADLGSQPANVIVERYIAHERLLPLCDVMLTHCGLNSVMACLTLGLPMVGVPLTADQPRNATRLTDLGAALVVEPAKRSPEAFRDATWEVLRNPSYRQGAEAIRDEISALPGSDHAVTLLERLARERRPIMAP